MEKGVKEEGEAFGRNKNKLESWKRSRRGRKEWRKRKEKEEGVKEKDRGKWNGLEEENITKTGKCSELGPTHYGIHCLLISVLTYVS